MSYSPTKFESFDITIKLGSQKLESVTIHGVKSISSSSTTPRPGLLCLHGFPQTHHMWHKVAPKLAEQFEIVATDLRGYGDSAKPEDDGSHEFYSKRAMAKDQVEVMYVCV